jgi:hypothetical protein
MLYPKRTNFTNKETGIALGSTKSFKLSRLWHLEALFVRVRFTVSTAANVLNADGLAAILKRVTLEVSHGSNTRTVVNVTGRGLLDWNHQVTGGNDKYFVANATANSTTTYTFYYPIWFVPPQIADPLGSAFLLPTPAFNDDPVLTLQFASAADVDVGTGVFAISAMEADVITHRREVLGELETLQTELVEDTEAFAASVTRHATKIATPGHYTGILIRGYTSTSARGDIMDSSGNFSLECLGTVIRRFRLLDEEVMNNQSVFAPNMTGMNAGNYYLDFLSDKVGDSVLDLGSVLSTNSLAGTGAELQLIKDITGGAGVKMGLVKHRIFGDIAPFKLSK